MIGYCLTTPGKLFAFTSSIAGGSASGTNSDNLDIQSGDKG